MTVKELIALLQTMPQDALVIQTFCSDYRKLEECDIRLKEPKDGEGIINHHGHIMHCPKKWRTSEKAKRALDWKKRFNDIPLPETDELELLTVVHFSGN